VDFNLENSLKFLYEDIYVYASPIAQHSALNNLNEVCQNELEQGSYSISEFQKLCENEEELKRLVTTCQTLKGTQIDEGCEKILSGELILECEGLKQLNPVNMSELTIICQKYIDNEISEPEFFSGFLLSLTAIPVIIPVKNILLPLITICVFLMGVLFMLHGDNRAFTFSIGRILFNIGMHMLIFIGLLYGVKALVPLDTSYLMLSMGGSLPTEGSIQESLPILVPLILFRLFDFKFLIIGLILILVGLLVKRYSRPTNI